MPNGSRSVIGVTSRPSPSMLGQAAVRQARSNSLLAKRRMGDQGTGSVDFPYTGKPVRAALGSG
jgi:hypothetical protein